MSEDNEIEVDVVDEIPSRLEDTDEVVVGARAEDLDDAVVSGSKTAPCADCGKPVWLAPSSQMVLRQHDWPVACVPCVVGWTQEVDDAPG